MEQIDYIYVHVYVMNTETNMCISILTLSVHF